MNTETKLCFSDLPVSRKELYQELGYGQSMPQSDVMEIIDQVWEKAGKIARPCFYYRVMEGRKCDRMHVEIAGTEFLCGSIIGDYLDGVERFAVFVTTAGVEYENWLHDLKLSGDLVSEYIADALGSVIAEGVVAKIGKELEAQVLRDGNSLTYPYSPGYCGWHVKEQAKLFSLLPEKVCGIRLTDSFLMVPIKSVSGIYGMGKGIERKAYACEICGLRTCYKRKQKTTNL